MVRPSLRIIQPKRCLKHLKSGFFFSVEVTLVTRSSRHQWLILVTPFIINNGSGVQQVWIHLLKYSAMAVVSKLYALSVKCLKWSLVTLLMLLSLLLDLCSVFVAFASATTCWWIKIYIKTKVSYAKAVENMMQDYHYITQNFLFISSNAAAEPTHDNLWKYGLKYFLGKVFRSGWPHNPATRIWPAM